MPRKTRKDKRKIEINDSQMREALSICRPGEVPADICSEAMDLGLAYMIKERVEEEAAAASGDPGDPEPPARPEKPE